MTKTPKRAKSFPSAITDLSLDDLMEMIDMRVAGNEIPWPLDRAVAGPTPFLWPDPPWGPMCPCCGRAGGQGWGGWSARAGAGAPAGGLASASTTARPSGTIPITRVWQELRTALMSLGNEFEDITLETKLADLSGAHSALAVCEAVNGSVFFTGRGVWLVPRRLGRAQDLDDVVAILGGMLRNRGFMVTS